MHPHSEDNKAGLQVASRSGTADGAGTRVKEPDAPATRILKIRLLREMGNRG